MVTLGFAVGNVGLFCGGRPGSIGLSQSWRRAAGGRGVLSSRSVRSKTLMAAASSSKDPLGETVVEETLKKNRLANEKSPYLLQHQYNPVDWYPWGDEAFEKAKSENKPIFLSVGYSTCHWCHVMERESFENDDVAKLLNEKFVPVKLDREERPDVDAVYMTYVQATSGRGGWPMSVFMTPTLKPFVGVTYLPLERFKFALSDISEKWSTIQDQLEAEGERVVNALSQYVAQPRGDISAEPTLDSLKAGCDAASEIFDEEEGGFSEQPKFPRPCAFEMLFAMASREPESSRGQRAMQMATYTLSKIANGGVYDHLRGGFHRYSVDNFWHVPHFEKMLYDQSQLVLAYVQAYQATRNELFKETAEGVLDYVAVEMTDKETGGFYSAEDADSEIPFSTGDEQAVKAEGAYYVWSQFETNLVLGEPATSIFAEYYGMKMEGNAPPGSDPQGEFEGKNILKVSSTLEEVAAKYSLTTEKVEKILSESRAKLLSQRTRRPRPHLDDKIITAWNGLMISAFARAASAFGSERWKETAIRAATFIHEKLSDGSLLFRNYRDGVSGIEGFAEDYASAIGAYLDVFELTGDAEWIRRALKLQETLDSLFWDPQEYGYFSTKTGDKTIILRRKEDYDGSELSPGSMASSNLLRLASITGREDLMTRMNQSVAAFSRVLENTAFSLPLLTAVSSYSLLGRRRVVIAGDPDEDDTKNMVDAFYEKPVSHIVLVKVGPDGPQTDSELFGVETKDMVARNSAATAYVCRGTVCMEPTTDLSRFREQLDQIRLP